MLLNASQHNPAFNFLFLAAIMVPLVGCSKKEKRRKPYVPVVVEAETATPIEQAKPVEKQPQSYIRLDEPIFFETGYIALVSVPERGSVLKIKSSANTAKGGPPKYYFHAQVEADTLEDLLDKDIETKVYVEKEKDSGIWNSGIDSKILVNLTVTDGVFNVKIVQGKMTNALTGETLDVTGEFECLESSK